MLRGVETVCRTKGYLIRKSRNGVQKLYSCEISGRERRIFLVAPIELLKMYSVELFRCFITDIRSLRFNSEVVLFQVC